MVMKTFNEALETLDPMKVDNGKLSDVWVEYGKYFKLKNNYKNCNQIFLKGSKVLYKTIDEYVNLW